MEPEWHDSDLQHDLSSIHWVSDEIRPSRPTTVGTLVPVGFDAYARVLQPVSSVSDNAADPLRWSDIARESRCVAHASMELEVMLSRLPGRPRSAPQKPVLPWRDQVATLAQLLRAHTTTPNDCWFAFWEGNTAFQGIPTETPRLTIAGFRYYLLRGPITRAVDTFHGLEHHMWWPEGREWCVTSHFDFPSTFIGGSNDCIEDVSAADELETWPAATDQPITIDSDLLNGPMAVRPHPQRS